MLDSYLLADSRIKVTMPDKDELSPLESLDRKLKAAKAENDGDDKDSEEEGIGKSLSFAMRVSVEITAGIVVGAVAGYYLDKWLGTTPLFFLLCFLIGTGAGGVNVYRMAMKSGRDDTEN